MDLETIESDLLTYADFEEVGSVSRARLFVSAAKRWLILQADTASSQSQSMTIGKSFVENLLTRAQNFVRVNESRGRVRFLGVGGDYR